MFLLNPATLDPASTGFFVIRRQAEFPAFAPVLQRFWPLSEQAVKYKRVSSMKSDIGLSLRIMAYIDISHLDQIWSEDDAAAWLMYGHPY